MKGLLIFSALILSSSLFAGECVMTIDRTACAGKETEMLKPYNGKNPTVEKKTVAALEECSALAEKASKIVRKGTLAGKKVTATFDGKALDKEFTEKAECK